MNNFSKLKEPRYIGKIEVARMLLMPHGEI